MAEWIIGLLGTGLIVIWMLHHALKNAPNCSCGRQDCGGGCTGKRKK